MARRKESFSLKNHEIDQLEELVQAAINAGRFKNLTAFETSKRIGKSTYRNMIRRDPEDPSSVTALKLRATLDLACAPADHPLYKLCEYHDADPRKQRTRNSPIVTARVWLKERWILGATFGGLLVAASAYFGLVHQNEQQRAQAFFQDRGIALTTDNIAEMLASPDQDRLELLIKAGVGTTDIEPALAKSADTFFAESRDDRGVAAWFEKRIASGLDPELLADHSVYGTTTLLHHAMEAGSVAAISILLEAGASPHPFATLEGRRRTDPLFLNPFTTIAEHPTLTNEQKRNIVSLMIEKGGVLYQSQRGVTPDTESVLPYVDTSLAMFSADRNFARSQILCSAYEARTEGDWCSRIQEIPTVINMIDRRNVMFYTLYVQDLVSIIGGEMYFFVLNPRGHAQGHGLLKVSTNGDVYSAYLHGKYSWFSKTECDGEWTGDNWDRDARCWRRFELVRTGPKEAVLNDSQRAELHYGDG